MIAALIDAHAFGWKKETSAVFAPLKIYVGVFEEPKIG